MTKVVVIVACLVCLGAVIALSFWPVFYSYLSNLSIIEQIFNWLPLVITFIAAALVFFVHKFFHFRDYSGTAKYCEDLTEIILRNALEGEFHKEALPFLKPDQIKEFLYELEEKLHTSALTTLTTNIKHDS